MANKRFIYLIIFFALLKVSIFANSFKDIKEAIDVAGKQRMLTQRFVKDYAMIGMNITYKDPISDLKKSMKSFDDALLDIEEFTKNDKNINRVIDSVKKEWGDVKRILEDKPSKEKLKVLSKKANNLLKLSNDVVVLLKQRSKSNLGEIINISGRQRMLSQKLASLYLIKSFGIKDIEFKYKLDKNIKLFKDSLDKLSKYEKNNPEINSLLLKVKSQFMFFEVMSRSNSIFTPSLIYKKSDEILHEMDRVTKLYTKL